LQEPPGPRQISLVERGIGGADQGQRSSILVVGIVASSFPVFSFGMGGRLVKVGGLPIFSRRPKLVGTPPLVPVSEGRREGRRTGGIGLANADGDLALGRPGRRRRLARGEVPEDR